MPSLTIIGQGRMGTALAAALRAAGAEVRGPFGRGTAAHESDHVVLLCVPDREIANAAATIAPGPIVGHVSASAPLELLAPHERFSMHPLLSVVGAGAQFQGAYCAIDGSTPAALDTARSLAESLGMRVKLVPRDQRALYHAAASMASNFLITLEGAAERLGSAIGLEREALVPLVRATVDNWARQGARAALTGPIARGDVATAARQREAVADSAPDMLPLWDALASATRELAVAPATDAA
jgi:predicted short-subunit dehydrogenase-like oxidoreductase (DUF2520 family)